MASVFGQPDFVPARRRAALLLSAFALCMSADAQSLDDPHAADLIKPGQKLSSDRVRRQRVEQNFRTSRHKLDGQEVVYGADDRRDRYQVQDGAALAAGDAVCSITTAANVVSNGDGTYRLLDFDRFTSITGSTICADEPFRGQLRQGFCTGFLVAPGVIATAGHCVSAPDVAFIFGFEQHGPGQSGPPDEVDLTHVPAANVYFATAIIDRQFAGDLDYAIVSLDRDVVGRSPLAVRRSGEPVGGDPLLLVGHGSGLPMKFDAGGMVQDPSPTRAFFTANLDAFGGSSGAPVINRNTGVVEGILVRGNSDFIVFQGCTRSHVCTDAGCPGFEEITRSSAFAQAVPQSGVQVTPFGGISSIGPVGGPFSSGSITYTLNNTSAAIANYSVSVDAGGGLPLTLNNVAGPLTGSLAPGANTVVTVAIAPAAAGLASGSYQSVVRFSDTSNGIQTTRTQHLAVGTTSFEVSPSSVAALSGQAGGPFIGTRFYTVTSTGATPVQVKVEGDQPWIAVDGAASQTFTLSGPGASRSLAVGASASAAGLGAGLYSGHVNFTNLSGGSGGAARDVTLEVGRLNYSSSGPPIALPDRGAIDGVILVNDPWCVGDVDVGVDISHGYVGDLVVELISPAGTVVRLKNRTGDSTVNLAATFDQQAAAGTLIPDGPGSLEDLRGQSAAGAWMLYVTDNASGHAGTLNSWSVRIVPQSDCAPIAQDQHLSLPPTLTSSINLFATTFSTFPQSFRVLSLPSHGTLFDPVSGPITVVPHDVEFGGVEVRYRPDLGYAGPDAFAYSAVENVASAPATVSLSVGVERLMATYDLSSDPGWAREGVWQYGVPAGAGTAPGDPHSGFTGPNVVGFNLAGDYPGGMPAAQYVTTGSIDLTGVQLPRLQFRRWLGVERNAFDRAVIQCSTDHGVTWTTLWINPDTTLLDSSWGLQSAQLPAAAGGAADVRLRWGMGPTDSIVNYAGWNIDDVRVFGLDTPHPACVIDLNVDGQIDLEDFFAFFNAFDQTLPEGDINADGQTDLADFVAFFDRWDSGACQ